jgi:hypothetical protein
MNLLVTIIRKEMYFWTNHRKLDMTTVTETLKTNRIKCDFYKVFQHV